MRNHEPSFHLQRIDATLDLKSNHLKESMTPEESQNGRSFTGRHRLRFHLIDKKGDRDKKQILTDDVSLQTHCRELENRDWSNLILERRWSFPTAVKLYSEHFISALKKF